MTLSKFVDAGIEGVWVYDTGIEGPTATLGGGMHGREKTGIKVIRQLVDGTVELPINSGRVVAFEGNPRAIELGTREAEDGLNLNRHVRKLTEEEVAIGLTNLPYTIRRGQEVKTVLDESDGSYDMHGFQAPHGRPFLIAEPGVFWLARLFGEEIISFGWRNTEPGSTDEYMDSRGMIGLCHELSWNNNPDQQTGIERGHQGVRVFLGAMGIMEAETADQEPIPRPYRYIESLRAVLSKSGPVRMTEEFISFQALRGGKLIAENGDEKIYAEEGQVIIFPSTIEDAAKMKPGDEAFGLGREWDPNNLPIAA